MKKRKIYLLTIFVRRYVFRLFRTLFVFPFPEIHEETQKYEETTNGKRPTHVSSWELFLPTLLLIYKYV